MFIKTAKDILRPFVAPILRPLKQFLRPTPSPTDAIARMFDQKSAVVVQVGSNDGVHGDPISKLIKRNRDWRILFIEPRSHVFDRLKQNYGVSHNYTFENVAISEHEEFRDLYYVSDAIKAKYPDVVSWYDQVGSFSKDHILKHEGHGFAEFITSESVRCEPLQLTLGRNEIRSIDLLHIDTEGYDFEVLKQINLAHLPQVILYEHIHLSPADQAAALAFLLSLGYRVKRCGPDTLAILFPTHR
jgi:FkbM family methyltransferase